VFDHSLPRGPNPEASQFGRQLPTWLAEHLADALECALDPGCEAEQCEEGQGDHPRVREVNAVVGGSKFYLCDRHMAEALDTGRIRPEVCVRCGRSEGVNMGHLLALGAAFTIWFRVCDRCRPAAGRELGVSA
jgi:hypothetical protein